MSERKQVTASREANTDYLNQVLPIRESFDLIQRDIQIGGRMASFYFIDGFMKDEVMLKIMDSLLKVKEEEMPADATQFSRLCVPYVEVDVLGDFDQVLKNLLSGVTCLFIDGYEACIAIDCRTYPMRSVEEPDKDKSLRGSRDGFVETVVFNTAMLRRRIRDPELVMEMKEVGDSSRTDVAVCYMKDRVDQALLKRVEEQIGSIKTGDLRMNQQSLAECLFRRKWYNPFPKFKFTERPDTAAACLLEGKVAILVDNSPSALILPTSIYDMIEEANDYYFPTLTRVYLKAATGADQFSHHLPHAGIPSFYAESQLAAGDLCLCGGEGYGEYPFDLPASHAGDRHRRPASGGAEYAQHAEHALKCDRRPGDGRVLGKIRLVQLGSHALHGLCGGGKLYPAQF